MSHSLPCYYKGEKQAAAAVLYNIGAIAICRIQEALVTNTIIDIGYDNVMNAKAIEREKREKAFRVAQAKL